MWKRVEAVVFGTHRLEPIRRFYEKVLGIDIARHTRRGEETLDISSSHINYVVDGLLIGFEVGDRIDTGGMVFQVDDLGAIRESVDALWKIDRGTDWFFVVHDPDGRELIIESRIRE